MPAQRRKAQDRIGRFARKPFEVHERREGCGVGPLQNPHQNPARRHRGNSGRRIRCREKFHHLMADAFARQAFHAFGQCRASSQAFRVDPIAAIPRMKPEKPQDAKIVLADAFLIIADKPHAPRRQIGKPLAHRIDNHAINPAIKRIHREIAAGGVLFHAVGEGDDRAAAIGFHIAPKGRDLKAPPLGNDSHRPVLDPSRHRPQARRLDKRDDPFGPRIGGDVEVGRLFAQKRIAHTAADKPRLMPATLQCRANRAGGGRSQPIRRDPRHGFILSARPRRIRAVAPQM